MKNYLLLILLAVSSVFGQNFPVSKLVPNTVTKFNISYQDDYSWLENMNSEETKNWVNAQNSFTNLNLELTNKEYNMLSKIKEYNFYSSNGLPAKKGAYYYSTYIKDKGKPGVLFYRKELNGDAIELFNPSKIYNNTTSSISGYTPSKNSKYIACKVTLDGSDRTEIRFVGIDKNEKLNDIISNVKFSQTEWNKDSGIFYKKNINQNNFAKDSNFQLYYHKLGTNQDNDKLVFDASKTGNGFTYFTKKDRLFIMETNKLDGSKNFYYSILNDNDEYNFVKFIDSDNSNISILSYDNNKVYFSSKEYDWGDIRTFDVADRSNEKVLIPQIYNNLLVDSFFSENYIFCQYKTIGKNYIVVYDQNGLFKRKFDSPEGTDFNFKFFDSKNNDLFISVFSKTVSPQNFKLNIESGEVRHYYNDYLKPKITIFPLDYFVTKCISYISRDGKDVPITIIYKKGTILNGSNPTLLEAYGGFGIVSELNYDPALLYFLDKGGIYAFAEIRGGGEKGLKWHKNGMGLKKQNSYNDFIDAAEFLIKEKYTSSEKLAISGGSNGGLVVGVAMTQRPELFKVAVPKVGVFDLMKFKNYTVGEHWEKEYGNPENKIDFESLLSFSPYHNIKEESNYPTTLIITSENDDRVVPMHSFKFAARLQNRAAQKNPIYLKILDDSGHYGVSNYNNYFEEKAAFYSFILYHLKK